MDIEILGNTIKQRREQLGLTQQTLSELSGIALRTVITIEKGQAATTLRSLAALAEALGMDIKLEVRKPM